MNEFSVIMPVHNGEKYLNDSIASVLNQTYHFFELIIVDDGSSDNSFALASTLTKNDKRVKAMRIDHGGVSNARNKGILKSTKKFILFIDADDVWENNLLEKCNNHLNSSEDIIDLLIFGIQTDFYSANNFIDSKKDFEFNDCLPTIIKSANVNNDFVSKYNIASPCNKVYKSSIIKKNNIFFNVKCVTLEDLVFNLTYLQNTNNVLIIHDNLYHYRFYTSLNQQAKRIFKDPFVNSDILYTSVEYFIQSFSKGNLSLLYDIAFNLYVFEFKSWILHFSKKKLIKKMNNNNNFAKLLDIKKGKKMLALRFCKKMKLYNLEAYILTREKWKQRQKRR